MTSSTGKTGGFWSRHLDKFGLVGSLVAALCCLGVPAVLAVVSAVGLGFLINDATLLPLLVVFGAILLLGLALGMRHHRSPWAFLLGLVSAFATIFFIFVRFSRGLAIAGILGLIVSSLLNIYLRQRQIRASRQIART